MLPGAASKLDRRRFPPLSIVCVLCAVVTGAGSIAGAAPASPPFGWYFAAEGLNSIALEFEVPMGQFVSIRGLVSGPTGRAPMAGYLDTKTNHIYVVGRNPNGMTSAHWAAYDPQKNEIHFSELTLRPLRNVITTSTTVSPPTAPTTGGGGPPPAGPVWVRKACRIVGGERDGQPAPEVKASATSYGYTDPPDRGGKSHTVSWTEPSPQLRPKDLVAITLTAARNDQGPMIVIEAEAPAAVMRRGSLQGEGAASSGDPEKTRSPNQSTYQFVVADQPPDQFTLRVKASRWCAVGFVSVNWDYERQDTATAAAPPPTTPTTPPGTIAPPQHPASGSLLVVTGGPVQIRMPDGTTRPAAAGDSLPPGATVETGPGGRAVVIGESGDAQLIEERSRVSLGSAPAAGAASPISLAAGTLDLVRKPGQMDTPVEINTPVGTVQARGPRARLTHDEGQGLTTVAASEGGVVLTPRNPDLDRTRLAAGQQAAMSATAIGSPQPAGLPALDLPPLTTPADGEHGGTGPGGPVGPAHHHAGCGHDAAGPAAGGREPAGGAAIGIGPGRRPARRQARRHGRGG